MPGKRIEYLDLAISLPPQAEEQINNWLEEFMDEFDHLVVTPKISKGILKINSQDFVEFLGYWESGRLSDFEVRRIKAIAEDQLKRLLNKAISSDVRYHYNWCLTAMNNFKEGRHRQTS